MTFLTVQLENTVDLVTLNESEQATLKAIKAALSQRVLELQRPKGGS